MELIGVFLRENAERLEKLQQETQSGNAAAVQQLAHGIKSTALNFNAGPLSDLARQIEVLGKANDLEPVPELVEQLSRELDRVKAFLTSQC